MDRQPLPPLGRRPAQLQAGPIAPPADDGWKPGDIAECLLDGQWRRIDGEVIPGPELGDRNRVVRLVKAPCSCPKCTTAPFLEFPGFGQQAYLASWFRKVTPQADAQVAAEPDFADRLARKPGLIAAVRRWQRRLVAALVTTTFCLVIAPTIAAFCLQVPR